MDGGAWWAAVHGVTKRQTQLSDFTFTCHFHALQKEMAIHSIHTLSFLELGLSCLSCLAHMVLSQSRC